MQVPISSSALTSPSAPSAQAESESRLVAPRWRELCLVLVVVWALSAGYMASYLKRGWVPHDEGAFAQSAERVLNGELPHRDFGELYTGGLTFVHALALRELGMNLGSLRIVLFAVFIAWVPALFYVASRFTSTYAAGAVTFLAVVWSVPNYSAAVPSWYNLFFAVFGAAALLRHIETGSRRWLFIAGICGGLSIIVKIVGLYFVAGVILFFLFREQHLTAALEAESRGRVAVYKWAMALGLALFVALLFRLINKIPKVADPINFVLPALALAALLLYREFSRGPGADQKRFATLLSMLAPFGLGIVVPTSLFLVPYIRSGSINALLQGVFVLPTKRFTFATTDLPNPLWMLTALAMLLPVVLASYCEDSRWRNCIGALVFGGCGAILILSRKNQVAYHLGWYSLATAIPLLVLTGAFVLGFSRTAEKIAPLRQQGIMLLLSVTAMVSLVQFPFAAPIYYCYVADLAILTATALFSSMGKPSRLVLGTVIAFYVLFAVLEVNPGFIYAMGDEFAPEMQTMPLKLPRAGGLRVSPDDAQLYQELIPLLQSHAHGEFIYASPDCPQLYFLSGLKNPTGTLFEFLNDSEDPDVQQILDSLESHRINVVVINRQPEFSPLMDPALRKALQERYSYSTIIDRFQVRWRE